MRGYRRDPSSLKRHRFASHRTGKEKVKRTATSMDLMQKKKRTQSVSIIHNPVNRLVVRRVRNARPVLEARYAHAHELRKQLAPRGTANVHGKRDDAEEVAAVAKCAVVVVGAAATIVVADTVGVAPGLILSVEFEAVVSE
jgi:isopropylmalate/homocitrate/citramalate synthase